MNTVKVRYRLFGVWLNYKGNLPASWGELSPQQLIVVGKNYLGEVADDVMLSVMAEIPQYIVRRLDSYQKYMLAVELDFMTDYKPISHFIIPKAGTLRAPAPRLEGMSFGQFMFVDTYYSNYLESDKEEDLNRFIGALYLPKGASFKSENLLVQSLIASKVPILVKHAISINYRLLKEFLTNAYPMVFQKPKLGTTSRRGDGWVKVFESVVGDDIVNEDKYAQLNVHAVLRWITKQIKKDAKAN